LPELQDGIEHWLGDSVEVGSTAGACKRVLDNLTWPDANDDLQMLAVWKCPDNPIVSVASRRAGLARQFPTGSAFMSASPALDFDPTRIRAAVFDYGGVLIEGGPREVVAFGARVGLTEEIWRPLRRQLFGNDGRWAQLERGELSYAEFTENLRVAIQTAGGSVSEEQAAAFMGDADPMAHRARLRPSMLEAVRRIRRRVPTALLTNNVREWREGWESVLEPASLFDLVIDSSEVGTRKPESRVYELTRERLGVAHDEIFFLDDIGQNLKAARALGWKTMLFTETDAVLPVLHALAEPE